MLMAYTFGFKETIAKLQARTQMLVDDVVEQLLVTGEEAINTARRTGDYMDWTGNLRNSIGYEVISQGEIVSQGTTQGMTASAEGYTGNAEAVEAEIQDAFRQHEKGINDKDVSLIVVAGMHYGKYVEELHGRTVTKTAFIEAEHNFKERMKTLKKEFTDDVKKIMK